MIVIICILLVMMPENSDTIQAYCKLAFTINYVDTRVERINGQYEDSRY